MGFLGNYYVTVPWIFTASRLHPFPPAPLQTDRPQLTHLAPRGTWFNTVHPKRVCYVPPPLSQRTYVRANAPLSTPWLNLPSLPPAKALLRVPPVSLRSHHDRHPTSLPEFLHILTPSGHLIHTNPLLNKVWFLSNATGSEARRTREGTSTSLLF